MDLRRASKSLPPRERGLKPLALFLRTIADQSLPPRERGLKLKRPHTKDPATHVAPPAGAWIET